MRYAHITASKQRDELLIGRNEAQIHIFIYNIQCLYIYNITQLINSVILCCWRNDLSLVHQGYEKFADLD